MALQSDAPLSTAHYLAHARLDATIAFVRANERTSTHFARLLRLAATQFDYVLRGASSAAATSSSTAAAAATTIDRLRVRACSDDVALQSYLDGSDDVESSSSSSSSRRVACRYLFAGGSFERQLDRPAATSKRARSIRAKDRNKPNKAASNKIDSKVDSVNENVNSNNNNNNNANNDEIAATQSREQIDASSSDCMSILVLPRGV